MTGRHACRPECDPSAHDQPVRVKSHGAETAEAVGHRSTHVTETVYRHVIVPAIRGGATVMDSVSATQTTI